YSKSQVIMLAATGAALCMLPLALIHNPIAAAIGFIGVQAMTSIRYTTFVIYTMELVPKVQQSVMAGIGEMAGGGSFALMSLIGGFIVANYGFQDLFLFAAGITLIGTGIFGWHTRQIKTKRKIGLV
ncbi:MAG: MFS transporter, partial [Aggregatilineales bacterium]